MPSKYVQGLHRRGKIVGALGGTGVLVAATLVGIWAFAQVGAGPLGGPSENPCPAVGEPITSEFLTEHSLDRPSIPLELAEAAHIVARTCYGSNDLLTGLDLHVTAPGEDGLQLWSLVMIGAADDEDASMPEERLRRQEARLAELIGKPPYLRHTAGSASLIGIDPRSQLAELAWDSDATVPVTELRWDPTWLEE